MKQQKTECTIAIFIVAFERLGECVKGLMNFLYVAGAETALLTCSQIGWKHASEEDYMISNCSYFVDQFVDRLLVILLALDLEISPYISSIYNLLH